MTPFLVRLSDGRLVLCIAVLNSGYVWPSLVVTDPHGGGTIEVIADKDAKVEMPAGDWPLFS